MIKKDIMRFRKHAVVGDKSPNGKQSVGNLMTCFSTVAPPVPIKLEKIYNEEMKLPETIDYTDTIQPMKGKPKPFGVHVEVSKKQRNGLSTLTPTPRYESHRRFDTVSPPPMAPVTHHKKMNSFVAKDTMQGCFNEVLINPQKFDRKKKLKPLQVHI